MSDPAIPPAIPAEPKWLGPYKSADEALDELRRSVAEIIGSDPETWPSHGNAPLAIASALALATPPAPATTVEMLDRIIASAEAMTRPMLLDWLRHERAALATPPTPAATAMLSRMVERLEKEARRLQQRTYGDRCVSPDCALASNLARKAADLLARADARRAAAVRARDEAVALLDANKAALEKERDEAQRELKLLGSACDKIRHNASVDRRELEARLAEVEKERDRWNDMHTRECEMRDRYRIKLEAAEAALEKAREALTPSAETKRAYIGEFSWEDEAGTFYVPWTTIKEIMAAIRARAALAAMEAGDGK